MFPIAYRLDSRHLRNEFAGIKLQIKTEGGLARKKWQPDYFGFMFYAMSAIYYAAEMYQDVEKVDFVVELNGPITKHLMGFHKSIPRAFNAIGESRLAALIGDILPAGKTCVPLQVADMLCWHTQAAETGTLSPSDERRYAQIAQRKGFLGNLTNDEISGFAERAQNAILDADDIDA